MPSTNYAYVNGRFVPEAEATVSIFDRGFLYGDGCFETMRVYGGKIFRLHNHLQRLRHGLKVLQIGPRITEEELQAILLDLLQRNDVKNGMARIYITRGPSDAESRGQSAWQPTIVAIAKQPKPPPLAWRVCISEVRLDAASKLAGIKSANRVLYELAQHEARNVGFTDALLLNGAGHVVELTTSNLFVVKKGELFTPPLCDGPLPGITREVVLILAAKLGITVHEESFGTEIFSQADEVFATNSLIELHTVDDLNAYMFRGREFLIRLRTAYREFLLDELEQS